MEERSRARSLRFDHVQSLSLFRPWCRWSRAKNLEGKLESKGMLNAAERALLIQVRSTRKKLVPNERRKGERESKNDEQKKNAW